MSVFVAIAVAMTAIALAWVLLPLLRSRPRIDNNSVRAANLSILGDQRAELERDLANGTISPAQHAHARTELERRVLEEPGEDAAAPRAETGAGTAARRAVARGGLSGALSVGVLIPLGALGLYLWLGEPAGLQPQLRAQSAEHVTPDQVDEMVARLAERLAKNPDDPRGWMMLARSYLVMQRMPEAAAAYAKAAEKITDDASLYADYADALAMAQGRNLEGKPLELVDRALKIDPNQPKALAMAGTAALYRKDFAGALRYWEKLLPLLPPESDMAKSIASGIAEARELGGIKAPAMSAGAMKPAEPLPPKSAVQAETKPAAQPAAQSPAGVTGASISGRVTLSPAVAAKAGPQDILFILARAVNGPRIPLAVLRKKVADLPVEFVLDDTQAMSPELKLSGFAEVVVSARVSKSGNAIAQSGDLQGASAALKLDPKTGARGVVVVIDSVVP